MDSFDNDAVTHHIYLSSYLPESIEDFHSNVDEVDKSAIVIIDNLNFFKKKKIRMVLEGLFKIKEANRRVLVSINVGANVEKRGGDKRPRMEDLNKYRNICSYLDLVTFLWRGEYYGIVEDEEGRSLNDRIELIVAKNNLGREAYPSFGFNKGLFLTDQ